MASDLLIRIGADLSALNGRLKQAENRLKRFGFRAESIGRDLSARVTLPIVGIGAAAVKTFAEFDRVEKGLAALAGTAEGGAAQFERLNAIVNDTQTTLDLKQAALGAQRLQTAGLSAAQAEETIRQLGIAATASGASIDDVGGVFRQFGQIIGKSKIEQEDLNTILDRVPALGAIIKEEFGTATAEGIRDTGISMQEFVVRTTEAIAANEKIQSVQGGLAKAFESFGNAVQVGIRPLGKAIADAINLEENLARLADFITRTSKAFSELNPNIQRFVIFTAGAAAAVGPLTFALGAVARSLPLLRSGFLTLSGPILGALGTFQTFLSGFVSGDRVLRRLAIDKAITRIRVAMVAVTGPIGIAVGVIALLTAGFIKAYRNSETFRNLLNRAGESVRQIGSFIADLVNRVLPDLNISFSTIGDVANVVFAAIGAGIAFIVSQFDAFVRTVRDVGSAVSAFLSGDFDRAGELIAGSLLNPVQFVRQAKESAEEAVRVFRESVEGEDAVELPAINTNNLFNDTASALTPLAGGGDVSPSLSLDLSGVASAVDSIVQGSESAKDALRGLQSVAQGVFSNDFDALVVSKALEDYNKAIDLTAVKQKVLGDTYDGLSERISLTKEILVSMVDGTLPATNEQIATYIAKLKELKLEQEELNETQEVLAAVGTKVASILTASFERVASGQQKLGRAIAQASKQIVKAFIQEGVAAIVKNELESKSGLLGILAVPIAAASGAAASALFTSILTAINVPFLAEGGITKGAGLFVAGEAGPEAIIPLDRLNDFMQSGPSELYGEIRADGSELLVVMQAAQARQNRSYGN
jgi:tape measure domain-containing protein